ncbi:hypothetical protein LX16_3426 [Stackebrandtia albiflava]|uniref:WD40 repeat protein n=1 Tax=Stackebrandtia albiflava TaxID=406432 RepID=A0A562V450_9ACTN|nr:hypothetical protein [Stackebrandtia albiflava]TWJ12664.1 hypothetical protein LX16_3426 [Stackebrandtia albiflava]
MTTRLRRSLRDSANDVTHRSLTEAAIRSGRRMRLVRNSMTGLAAVIVAAGVVGGYAVMRPGETGAPPAEETATETTAWTALPATVVYQWYDEYTAVSVTDGVETSIRLPYSEDDGTADRPPARWTVSPDGGLVTVVHDDALRIGPLDGSEPTVVLQREGLCHSLTWSPDSRSVLVGVCSDDANSLLVVDVETGAAVEIADVGELRSALWTSDGGYLVWGHPDHGWTIADPDGGNRRDFDAGDLPSEWSELMPEADRQRMDDCVAEREANPGSDCEDWLLGEKTARPWEITGVSPDGRYVCHQVLAVYDSTSEGFEPGDGPESSFDCNVIWDTVTDRKVTPGGLDDYREVVFGPTGEILTRGHPAGDATPTLHLFDAGLSLIDSREEGDGDSADSQLGSYTS